MKRSKNPSGNEDLRIENALMLTMNPLWEIVKGGILVREGRVAAVGRLPKSTGGIRIDAAGMVIIPGFVQTHVHLCQALLRNMADDLPLLDWLKRRIWPMEAAHTEKSITLSARLGVAELIRGGTTTILDMGTVYHTDAIFRVMEETGLRGYSGKALMDSSDEVPAGLRESTRDSIRESLSLFSRWDGKANGRIRYAFSPRFALSSSRELIEEAAFLAREYATLFHSHASESRLECKTLRERTGMDTIAYLGGLGALGPNSCLAHCIHVNSKEMRLLAKSRTHVLHCPSANLKLGSGIAKIPEMREMGISVSLGADGAACNNNLDMFQEMRVASLIQKVRLGPEAMPAREVFRMATRGGAEALGLGDEIGSIEPGKRADLVLLDLCRVHALPAEDPYSQIVYSAKSSDVHTTIVDGKILMRDRCLLTVDEEATVGSVPSTLARLLRRAPEEN